ncbi:MAG: histidine phosphatase family protein [Pseudolabrys sp.]|nr:histidine phosphatase family protein [Pseudolabrys sp.]
MRRLLLLRHAKTETALPGKDDLGRVLVERGRDDAARMGAYMASHSLVPDSVILSPAARSQQTWQHMAGTMKQAPGAKTLDQIYDATSDDIFEAVVATPASVNSLLIVGHNPGIHEAALMLIASGNIDARELVREGMPTTGLVIIDFAFDEWSKVHPQSGRLERFVTPKALDPASR